MDRLKEIMDGLAGCVRARQWPRLLCGTGHMLAWIGEAYGSLQGQDTEVDPGALKVESNWKPVEEAGGRLGVEIRKVGQPTPESVAAVGFDYGQAFNSLRDNLEMLKTLKAKALEAPAA